MSKANFFFTASPHQMIFKSPRDPIDIPDLDLYTFLFTENDFNKHASPDKKVLVDAGTGKSITYRELREQSAKLAYGWNTRAGLQKGDVVAVFAPNQVDHPVLYYSLLAAKCTISPGNPSYTESKFPT
jgi:4-coumarate--CoA ligase